MSLAEHPAVSLAGLSPAQLVELDRLAAIEAANPCSTWWLDPPGIGRWGAADWQRAAVLDPARNVIVRKGNKVGGTTLLSWTAWAFLLDIHPRLRRPRGRPAVVLYAAADLENAYADDVCRSLHEFHTPAALSPACRYSETEGYRAHGHRSLLLRDGSRIVFRSGRQEGLAVAGIWADLVLVNEPPRRNLWGEIMRAAGQAQAPVLMSFTPLPPEGLPRDDDLQWLQTIIADRAAGWSEHVVPLAPDTAPHRTPAAIAEQVANMHPWERPQRQGAAWEGPAPARSLANWDDTQVWRGDGWERLPGAGEGEIRLGLGADHGELGGHEVVLLIAWRGRGRDALLWVVDEYQSPERTTIAQDAAAVIRMLARHGLSPAEIDEARGDVNTMGKSRLTSVNAELSRELASQSTGKAPRFQAADKGAGSVALGVRLIDNGLGERRVWVHERCQGLRRALRRWKGDDDDFKHWIDSWRYIAVPHLDPGRAQAPVRLVRG